MLYCITETNLNKKHSDHLFVIDGYMLFRRDRAGQRALEWQYISAIDCNPKFDPALTKSPPTNCYYYYYYRLLRHKGSTQKTCTKH